MKAGSIPYIFVITSLFIEFARFISMSTSYLRHPRSIEEIIVSIYSFLRIAFPNSISIIFDIITIKALNSWSYAHRVVYAFLFIIPAAYFVGKYVEYAINKYGALRVIFAYILFSIAFYILSLSILFRL